MFELRGQVEEIGQFDEGHGFVISAGDMRVKVTGLTPQYVKQLGAYLYSDVTVRIDDGPAHPTTERQP